MNVVSLAVARRPQGHGVTTSSIFVIALVTAFTGVDLALPTSRVAPLGALPFNGFDMQSQFLPQQTVPATMLSKSNQRINNLSQHPTTALPLLPHCAIAAPSPPFVTAAPASPLQAGIQRVALMHVTVLDISSNSRDP